MTTDEKLIESKFGRFSTTTVKKVEGNLVVMYTRVSGKGQFDKNDSLETQRKAIEEYAARNNLIIVSRFGDTYESAKTDKRDFKIYYQKSQLIRYLYAWKNPHPLLRNLRNPRMTRDPICFVFARVPFPMHVLSQSRYSGYEWREAVFG